ncbi:hypothetical protein Aspvir_001804 [Aspergillus viridinutans]|uniref:Nephrocystin 3-like N-terminal domain-containing protein n=1 Tax=Aspergillus viridinutans TaxID=75553 RepID=A0A9P3F9B9_ASPVI|nr:uncharacterized protein Aspvir_001804 [Aspergillus viridinutans]GIK06160.1 hypothetical protein Aspvir_001804 [Aspergillus viridinutans]
MVIEVSINKAATIVIVENASGVKAYADQLKPGSSGCLEASSKKHERSGCLEQLGHEQTASVAQDRPGAETQRMIQSFTTSSSQISSRRLVPKRLNLSIIVIIGGLLEGSYKWILDHSDFQRWRNDDQSRLLWIKGDPGKGKTMLLIGIVDELDRELKQAEPSASPTVLSYFFCQGTDTSASRVKWIISTRNRHDIEQQLKLNDSQTKLSLELKSNTEYVSHAVGVYINDSVSQLESLQDNDTRRDQVQHILRQKAADTFLWVALIVQELKTVASWDVLDVLKEISTGLEELQNPEFCQLMLSTATLAYRPLHVLELGVLSGLPEKISNKAQRVRELSAKDYLMSDMATTTIFPTGTSEVHRDMSLQSLQAMLKTLRRDIYSLRHPGFSIDDLKMPVPDPLASVQYSCIHWVDHLCEAPQRNDLVDSSLTHKFLEGHLLYWAKASSLLGALSNAVLTVGNLERLLKVSLAPQ